MHLNDAKHLEEGTIVAALVDPRHPHTSPKVWVTVGRAGVHYPGDPSGAHVVAKAVMAMATHASPQLRAVIHQPAPSHKLPEGYGWVAIGRISGKAGIYRSQVAWEEAMVAEAEKVDASIDYVARVAHWVTTASEKLTSLGCSEVELEPRTDTIRAVFDSRERLLALGDLIPVGAWHGDVEVSLSISMLAGPKPRRAP